jgi:hypothetical protein
MSAMVEDDLPIIDSLDDAPKSVAEATRRQVLEQLLKQKQDEAAGLLSTYVKAYAVFLAITGAMLKFALDANATPTLREALCLLGIASCTCAFMAGVFGERLRRDTRVRLQEFLDLLGVNLEADQLQGVMYTTITGVAFTVFILGGWLFILQA